MKKEVITIVNPLLPPQEELNALIKEIYDSKWVTNNGKVHQQLEKELHHFLDVKDFVLFNNGTVALVAALKSILDEVHGEIITTPFTFAATPHSITNTGNTPVFADVCYEKMTLDPQEAEKLINKNTVAIMPVHVYGMPCDVEAFDELSKKYGVKIIYDGAHVVGTKLKEQGIGNWGDATAYSFHATKLYNTVEGGGVAIKPEYLERLKRMRNFGILDENTVLEDGVNGKLSEFHAAVGLLNLKYYQKEYQRRQEISELYTQAFSKIEGLKVLELPENTTNSLQYYVLRVSQEYKYTRDQVYGKLKEQGVLARKYFQPICTDFKCYKNAKRGELFSAQKIAQEILCLPLNTRFGNDTYQNICDLITT